MKTNKKHIDQFVKGKFDSSEQIPSTDLFSKIQKTRVDSVSGLSLGIKILITIISIATVIAALYLLSSTKSEAHQSLLINKSEDIHFAEVNTQTITQLDTNIGSQTKTVSKLIKEANSITFPNTTTPKGLIQKESSFHFDSTDFSTENKNKPPGNIQRRQIFTNDYQHISEKSNKEEPESIKLNQADTIKSTTLAPDNSKSETNRQNQTKTGVVSLELLPVIGYTLNMGKFATNANTPFYLQENTLLHNKASMEYGILLSMSYNNLKLESGFSTGKMNWKLNYTELPVLTDSIITMEITQEEVWIINQITDTSGMVVHTDSVLSHTYSDTSYKTQYTTSNPPTERGNISISYYQIPFQIGYEFHFKRHRIQPYLGASLLLPYKSSGIIRKEKYELDDFNSKYSINKSLINYSIGIRYSYDLTKRTGIYTSVNFRSSNEYLFSHDEINFKTNQISIRAGIRYKLF